MYEIISDNTKLTFVCGARVFGDASNGETVSLIGGNEFVLYYEDNGVVRTVTDRDLGSPTVEATASSVSFRYRGGRIAATVGYRGENGIFRKKVTFSFGKKTFIKRLCLENATASADVTRGGEGQPVFIRGEGASLWAGLDFPAANDCHVGRTLYFTQAPFTEAVEFASMEVMYCLSDDAEKSFVAYVRSIAGKKKPFRLYCDWGLHDDLSPEGPFLSEKMTLDNVRAVSDFCAASGTKFDYYLMDAYWFEMGKPYTDFNSKTFPDGPAKVVEAVEKAGMKFGLWFDLNSNHAKINGYDKFDAGLGNDALCFACDEVAEMMTSAILRQIRECNVKMIKLDFAYFECKNPLHRHSTEFTESKEKSVYNFIKMVKRLKEECPELVVICYNGWTTRLDYIGSIEERDGYAVSPLWTEYVDYVYCGDPRPSEIAAAETEKSLAWYSDSMIRTFTECGFPLDRIDDHGTMLGNTSTIYYLGKKAFRIGTLLDVMRGLGRICLYGDVSLLNEDDAKYWSLVHGLFEKFTKCGYRSFILDGDPRKSQPYGYSFRNEEGGCAAVVNPTGKEVVYGVRVQSPAGAKRAAKVVVEDGEIVDKALGEFGDVIPLRVGAYGYVLAEWINAFDAGDAKRVTLLPGDRVAINTRGKGRLKINFSAGDSPVRTAYGMPEGFALCVDGKPVEVNRRAFWSGVSWICADVGECDEAIAAYDGRDIISMRYETEDV